MNKYLIKLYPTQPFFFGGEKTFDSGDESNYFIRSNYFPQQTALLGLLRYQLLKQAGKLKKEGENWSPDTALIGQASFNASSKASQDFGKIKSLSPVFIRYEDCATAKNYIPLSFDYAYQDDGSITKINFKKSIAKVKTAVNIGAVPVLENYKAKNEIAHLLIEAEGAEYREFDFDKEKSKEAPNGVFIKSERVGIMKSKTESRKQDAFYRQEFYQFHPKYCFAFFAEIECELVNDLVSFGKESTMFQMEIKDAGKQSFESLFTVNTFSYLHGIRQNNGVILTSDAFVDKDINESCDFAIAETIDFRNIQTPSAVSGFGQLDRQHRGETTNRYRSGKYNLLKRGSILYGNPDKITPKLNHENFKTIGYNQYITF